MPQPDKILKFAKHNPCSESPSLFKLKCKTKANPDWFIIESRARFGAKYCPRTCVLRFSQSKNLKKAETYFKSQEMQKIQTDLIQISWWCAHESSIQDRSLSEEQVMAARV